MEQKFQEKGNELERAVELIERQILASNPSLKDHNYTVERKKILVINGVKHEIDVMVKVDLGHGYQSTFIFECKNWEESIGKNEIIVFSEKIKALAATKGYFIAKSFGQYATAQAALDDRIELITATPDFPFFFPSFHYIFPTLKHTDVVLDLKSIKPLTVPIDLANARARLDGKDINLMEEIKSLGMFIPR